MAKKDLVALDLEKEISEFETILRVMSYSPKRIQDPRIYYSNEDIDRLHEKTRTLDRKKYPQLHQLGEELWFGLFMIMQCNGYGKPEVLLQERARDVLGFVRTFKRRQDFDFESVY